MSDAVWYKDGLNFSCTGCGGCCTGAPGYVWLNLDEIEALAKRKELSLNDFVARYTRRVAGRYSLLEKPNSYDCVFLDGKACTVYEARPTQCRTFPWWPQNLSTPESWLNVAKDCEGINPQAELVPLSTIQRQCEIQEKS